MIFWKKKKKSEPLMMIRKITKDELDLVKDGLAYRELLKKYGNYLRKNGIIK